jgi:hypothetical protein
LIDGLSNFIRHAYVADISTTLCDFGAAASPDFDVHSPATALGFLHVVSGGAHCGFIVLPASPKVRVGLNWDAWCVAAQQYAAINPSVFAAVATSR